MVKSGQAIFGGPVLEDEREKPWACDTTPRSPCELRDLVVDVLDEEFAMTECTVQVKDELLIVCSKRFGQRSEECLNLPEGGLYCLQLADEKFDVELCIRNMDAESVECRH